MNKSDLSVKDSDVNESIFVFNSSAESSNVLRNRHENKQTRRTSSDAGPITEDDCKNRAFSESPVWCIDFCNDLIILGCADGRLEFWEASSGKLMVSAFVNYINLKQKCFRFAQFE